jgi:mannose-1-phosphate guanylyltransferase
MKGLVLAAGLGTRLRPVTEHIAKPALPLVGVPTLWFNAWWLSKKLNLNQLAINCSYRAETVIDAINYQPLKKASGIDFYISNESELLLGTAGALKKLESWVGNSTLAVINADAVFLPDWNELLKRHQKSKAKMTLHLTRFQSNLEKYTHIDYDDHGRVLEFCDRRTQGVMFSGAYFIESQVIRSLPSGPSDLLNEVLKPLAKSRELYCYVEDLNGWFDTGNIKSYENANFNLLSKLPQFSDLTNLVMQEIENGVWVPNDINKKQIKAKLVGPLVIAPQASSLLQQQGLELGPNLIAVQSSSSSKTSPLSHCVVIGRDIYPIAYSENES